MCNHYRNDVRKLGASRDLYGFEEFSEIRIRFPDIPIDVFPDGLGLVVRQIDGMPDVSAMRWGFPPPPNVAGGRPVTNVRNLQSRYWQAWLKPESRCLVPFTM